ncbi:MAG: sigma 54-interacting transcriptional regulator [Planctomycetes bacterium]|nr:sigma 54-interacting transcriptional regulator [Planctomycetota bacterium]
MVPSPGDASLGGFRLRGILAAGPAASSYLAVAGGGSRPARWVLKTLELEAGGAPPREVLRRDMADLASLRHISLALPAAFGRDPGSGRIYLARAFVQGAELLEVAKARSAREVLPWLIAAAEALGILHRFGFLHRNVKPSSFIVPRSALARSGTGARVVLCDPAWWPEGERLEAGAALAPELRSGESAAFASDLYALGGGFYRLLTGKEPRAGADGFPAFPGGARSGLAHDLKRILLKLLHPDPRSRYQRAETLADDLRGLAGSAAEGVTAPPDYFFDREEERERVVGALRAGRPVAVALGGEAGIGKSAFLRRLAVEAQLLGCRTVLVRCGPEHGVLALPLAAILEQAILPGPRGQALRARSRRLFAAAERDGEAGGRGWLFHEARELFLEAASDQPTVVLVDDAHQASPLVIGFLAALVREVSAAGGAGQTLAGRRLPGMIVSFRSESPFRPILKPLTEALEARGSAPSQGRPGAEWIELGPLSAETVEEWVDLVLPEQPGVRDQIQRALQLQGRPLAIQEALRVGGGAPFADAPALSGDLAAAHRSYLAGLGSREREAVETLAVLGRPAEPELLAALLGCRVQELEPGLERLLRTGTLREESGLLSLRHASFRSWILETLSGGGTRDALRAVHQRIAACLARRRGQATEEVAFHWLRSPAPRKGIPWAVAAARKLARAGEDRRALEFYQGVLSILPPAPSPRRRALQEEAAEAHSRVGEHGRSIELLEGLLAGAEDARHAARLHGRLGVFRHRSGDVARAVSHLEAGLALLKGAPDRESLRDRLRIASELAEISSKKGDYARAQALCLKALEDVEGAGAGRTARDVRHAEMILLETLAHVKLRRFEHREAREIFERSLELSEEIDAAPERVLILNNLAVLHNQENRFREAIERYQEAERLCARRGGDLSLVNVHSNLAHLYAKIGQPEAAEEAVRRAAYHDERSGSRRTRFLRLHCAGMVDLCFGRYEKALEAFQEASALARELEDLFLAGFDLVYLGECHLFRGEVEAAEDAFGRATSLGPSMAPPVASMVAARRAAALALRDRARDARAACAAAGEMPASIPFVDAWNKVFLGWAHRLLGQRAEASGRLEEARAFFARVGAPQGEIHAELELSAVEADSGDLGGAERRLRALRARHACGRGALKNPMLSARLLAYLARTLLEQGPPDLEEASTLLVEAESYLVGRRLRDLESSVRELRARLERLRAQGGGDLRSASREPRPGSGMPTVPTPRAAGRRQEDGVPGRLVEGLKGLLGEIEEEAEDVLGAGGAGGTGETGGARSLRAKLRELGERVGELGRALSDRGPAPAPVDRSSNVGQSAAVRGVVAQVLELSRLELPVLITGETGTGKELVARAIHGESARGAGPFISLNCAALPEELLEAELFGYRQGAFTGADRDHPGLLVAAGGGTALFDEVGGMPLSLQAKLLRVFDRGLVRPLGAAEEVRIDVRYLFSSNRDLRALVDDGSFRSDLYFRLGAFEVRLPPLRDRREDLPALVDHFRRQAGAALPLFDEGALRVLAAHGWPGNVRELENLVKRLVLTCGERVTAADVRGLLGRAPAEALFPPHILRGRPLDELRAQLEREYLRQLYKDRGGSLKAMASALGIKLKALYKRLHALGVRPRDLGGP